MVRAVSLSRPTPLTHLPLGDSDEEVRVILAGQMHEVARLVGREHCATQLLRPLIKLLRDESQGVQAATLPFLGLTLQVRRGLLAGEGRRMREGGSGGRGGGVLEGLPPNPTMSRNQKP